MVTVTTVRATDMVRAMDMVAAAVVPLPAGMATTVVAAAVGCTRGAAWVAVMATTVAAVAAGHTRDAAAAGAGGVSFLPQRNGSACSTIWRS
jgi:hypothetical protein